MAIKHTPGPWYVVPCLTGAISINKDKQIPLATVGGASWHLGAEMCEANARLIAAAPELLAALKGAKYFLEGEDYLYARVVIRAAIIKAEGGKP